MKTLNHKPRVISEYVYYKIKIKLARSNVLLR